MRKEGVTVEVERAMGMDQEEGGGERESGGARFDDDVPMQSALFDSRDVENTQHDPPFKILDMLELPPPEQQELTILNF